MGMMVVLGVFIGVTGVLDADEPTYWGTFTEERCERGNRYGCRSVGTWVSDDGSIRLENVYLDGRPASDGTTDASYQPTGLRNDADNNIVHGPFGHALEPLVPWMLVGLGVFMSTVQWRRWRRTWRPGWMQSRPGPQSPTHEAEPRQ